MKVTIAILLGILITATAYSQNNFAKELIRNIKQNNIISLNYVITETSESDLTNLINLLNQELTELSNDQRHKAYNLVSKIGTTSSSSIVKRNSLELLVHKGLIDDNTSNREAVIEWLYDFEKDDFEEPYKNYISSLIIKKETPFKSLVRLAGYINITAPSAILKDLLNDTSLTFDEKWAIHIYLAKNNDETSLQYCISTLNRIGFNDLSVNVLIPDMIYIRKKEITDILLTEILKDENKCSTPNPESDQQINCAYRLIEALAPIIQEFPFTLDASGDLDTEDYLKALEITREWIHNNFNNYTLRP